MNANTVCEKETQALPLEDDIARRWWSLPAGAWLPLSNGKNCQVRYVGRPGGGAGPDVRDAIVCFKEKEVVGDVEFHVRASDWFAHGHAHDPRYNRVILHVVLLLDDDTPAARQDGTLLPTCSLNDLAYVYGADGEWPCQRMAAEKSNEERMSLLERAGLLRFEQKQRGLLKELEAGQPTEGFSTYDACLIPVLAEGLGYGRDRAFFRAVGLRLIGQRGTVPEPAGHKDDPSPLDARRLRILRKLVERWATTGAWQPLREAIGAVIASAVKSGCAVHYEPSLQVQGRQEPPLQARLLEPLWAVFEPLNRARADILICNVVLPFAAAVGQKENDARLVEWAQWLYRAYPALSSNQVTRAMSKQLQLQKEPRRACLQQGLHYVYAQTCQEKLCHDCIFGERQERG